jgi:hypothetical protein
MSRTTKGSLMKLSRNWWMALGVWVFVGGALLGGVMCAGAQAGQYHVYSCRTPDGQVAPVDGWSESVSQANDHTANTCASGGGLVAALNAGHSHAADTDLATWAFNAPAGETLGAATVWRAGDTAGGGDANDSYFFWLAGVANSGESTVLFDKCNAFKGCSSEGSGQNPLAANNRVEVPDKALHSPYLSLNASCGSLISASECSTSPGDEHGYASTVELFAADLVLNEESPPTIQEVAGPLAEGPTVGGTTDVSFTAGDSGSGVYEAVFQVDGETIQKSVLDTNGGKCHDAGETTDGLPAFLYTRPCPPSASVDVPLDTTAIPDGTHHLLVSVTDAAGNMTPVMDKQITMSNHATPPNSAQNPTSSAPGAPNAAATSAQPQDRGAANGSGASDQATLSAHWKGAGVRVTSAYGKAHTLEGRLTAPGGGAIAGASIDVSELPASVGARSAGLPAAHTDASGRFTLRVPHGLASGTLRLGYRSHLADTNPVATRTLTLAVKVAAQLSVSPTVSAAGQSIRFKGRLLGGAIPRGGKQLVLEARSPGNHWIQFNTIRTDSHGAFRASYRFRLPGPVPYSFRVVSRFEADYPFLAGSSNVVGVLER